MINAQRYLLLVSLLVSIPASGQLIVHEFADPPRALFCDVVFGSDGRLYGMSHKGGMFGNGAVFRVDAGTGAWETVGSFERFADHPPPPHGIVEHGGFLYGPEQRGGPFAHGSIFRIDPSTGGFETVASFDGSEGRIPTGGLVEYGGDLFGPTLIGGDLQSIGTIFRLNPVSESLDTEAYFEWTGASYPYGHLVEYDGLLYGTSSQGGANNLGTIYELDPAAGSITPVYDVTASLGRLFAGMVEMGGFLYGSTGQSIYRFDPATSDTSVLLPQASSTLFPHAGLLYGSKPGGAQGYGTLFSLDPATPSVTPLEDYGPENEGAACVRPHEGALWGATVAGGAVGNGSIFRYELATDTLTTISDFANLDGRQPLAGVAVVGDFIYGTTSEDGAGGFGTIFKFDRTTGISTTIADFTETNGTNPYGRLVEKDGMLYGTASEGGSAGLGTLFRLDLTSGVFEVLVNFTGTNGALPFAGLAELGGMLYGTSSRGGASDYGTVFRVDPSTGIMTTAASFSGANGIAPMSEMIVAESFLYGTAVEGGSGGGTVFRFDPSTDLLTMVAHFPTTSPYPTKLVGGLAAGAGSLFGVRAQYVTPEGKGGTVFRVDPTTGDWTTIATFLTAVKGGAPSSAPVFRGGYLYGTTSDGGAHGFGTIYSCEVSTGKLEARVHFDVENGGFQTFDPSVPRPIAGLVEAAPLAFWGTTPIGGKLGGGTLFSWSAAATGDFDTDGDADLLWRHGTNGLLVLWRMNRTAVETGTDIGVIPTSWVVAGTGDFNLDGEADILWRSATSGALNIWLMKDQRPLSGHDLPAGGSAYRVAGVADLVGGPTPDILWHNPTSGLGVVWEMEGTTVVAGHDVFSSTAGYRIAGLGDFDLDGETDLLWRHSNGYLVIWFMNGTSIVGAADVGGSSTAYEVGAVGDYDGDGRSDIVWRNPASGDNVIWLMDGNVVRSGVMLPGAPGPWKIVGPGRGE